MAARADSAAGASPHTSDASAKRWRSLRHADPDTGAAGRAGREPPAVPQPAPVRRELLIDRLSRTRPCENARATVSHIGYHADGNRWRRVDRTGPKG